MNQRVQSEYTSFGSLNYLTDDFKPSIKSSKHRYANDWFEIGNNMCLEYIAITVFDTFPKFNLVN